MRKSDPKLPILFLGTKKDIEEDIMVNDEYALSFKEHYGFLDSLKVSNRSGEQVKNGSNKLIEKMVNVCAWRECYCED